MLTHGGFLVYNINIMTFKFLYPFLVCLLQTITGIAQNEIKPLETKWSSNFFNL